MAGTLHQGDEVHFSLETTDSSTAVAIPIFRSGSNAAITLADNQIFTFDTLIVVSEDALDVEVYLGAAGGSASAAETVVKGEFGTTGGVVSPFIVTGRSGTPGDAPFVEADIAGKININGTGRITEA